MNLFDHLVEKRIAEAGASGAFDDLPGTGKPLVLDDDLLVPEPVRVAYRVLRNAGMVPPEIDQRRELAQLRQDVAGLPAGEPRARALRKLQLLALSLAETGGGPRRALSEPQYFAKVLARLGAGA